jgi:hypothetical protein
MRARRRLCSCSLDDVVGAAPQQSQTKTSAKALAGSAPRGQHQLTCGRCRRSSAAPLREGRERGAGPRRWAKAGGSAAPAEDRPAPVEAASGGSRRLRRAHWTPGPRPRRPALGGVGLARHRGRGASASRPRAGWRPLRPRLRRRRARRGGHRGPPSGSPGRPRAGRPSTRRGRRAPRPDPDCRRRHPSASPAPLTANHVIEFPRRVLGPQGAPGARATAGVEKHLHVVPGPFPGPGRACRRR